MKNLIILALLASAGWYGWQNKDTLFAAKSHHEAVIVNETDVAIVSLRLTIGDKTLVRDRVDAHGTATLPVHAEGNASFSMRWRWEGRETEPEWKGGFFQQGPVPTRHRFVVDDGGGVVWTQERLPTS